MLETLNYTIRIGGTPTILYFDLYRRTVDLPFVGLGVVGLDQANMLGISLGPNRLGFPLKCALQTRVYSLTGMLSHRIRCSHILSNFGFFSGKR